MPKHIIWSLIGPKTGDNQQLRTLAQGLPWPVIEKVVAYYPWEGLTHFTCGPNVYALKSVARSQLIAPWPELVLTAGRRNEPIARWIQRQAKIEADQRVKLVHVGRPWTHLAAFDLILTTRQYHLPQRASVVWLDLPLHSINRPRLDEAAQIFAAQFAHLPRPFVGVLLGGNSGSLTFHPRRAEEFAQQLNTVMQKSGGALLITNSRRTPNTAFTAFLDKLSVPHFVHRVGEQPNPYLGILALSDFLVVTADSASMIAESCATNKPVYLLDLRASNLTLTECIQGCRFNAISHSVARYVAPKRLLRDLPALIDELVQKRRVQWFNDETELCSGTFDDFSELDREKARMAILKCMEN